MIPMGVTSQVIPIYLLTHKFQFMPMAPPTLWNTQLMVLLFDSMPTEIGILLTTVGKVEST